MARKKTTGEVKGWALQKPRGGSTRFEEKVKYPLNDKFYGGVKSWSES